jgi:anti-anti-sigma factor
MAADAREPRLQITRDGNSVVARFVDCTALNEYTAELAGRELLAVAEGQPRQQVTLDLSGVDYITSTVLSHLVRLHKRLLSAGGHLTLANPRPAVRDVFRVTLLDQVLDIQPPG